MASPQGEPDRCPSARCGLAFEVRVVGRQVRGRPVLPAPAAGGCRAPRRAPAATWPAMSACTWNTSVSDASNGCCHLASAGRPPRSARGSPAPGSCRPAPSPSAPCRSAGSPRPARAPISCGVLVVPRYCAELLRAMTRRPGSAGELAAHRVGDAVGEVGVGRVAQVLEREHGDAALVARRLGVRPGGCAARRTARPAADEEAERPGRRRERQAPARRGRRRGTAAARRRRPDRRAPPAARSSCPSRPRPAAPGRTAPPWRTGRPAPAPAPSGSPASTASGTLGRAARTLGGGSREPLGDRSPARSAR